MKPRHPVSRENVAVTVLLVVLALLAIALWFRDPAHRYTGESRVGWPPAPTGKP